MSRRFTVSPSRGATLVVTVDCGAVSREPFEVASQLGLDVIVFDHHQAPEVLPKTAALVDPNREDDLSGLGYLCAAGVVFMALVALNRALREAGFWNGGKGPDLHRRARSRGARDRRRRRAADRAQPRLCRQGPRDHAGAPPSWACRFVRHRRRRRTAAALPFGLCHRPAHQRGRTHRRRGAWASGS